jgi:F-type H+-transporting ATPase subunit epsilon
MAKVKVTVATADREVYSGEADFLVAPGAAGELGIMPRHAPLLTALVPGELRITHDGEVDEVFISGGYMEVQPDVITVLADTAERAADLDEAKALEAKRRAEEILEKGASDIDVARAEAELAAVAAMLQMIKKRKKH